MPRQRAHLGVVLDLGLGAARAQRGHAAVLEGERDHLAALAHWQHRLLVQLAAVVASGDVPDVQDVVNPTALGVRLRAIEVPESLKYPFDCGGIIAQEIGSLGYVISIPTGRLMFSVVRFRGIWHIWYLRDLSTRLNSDKHHPCVNPGIASIAIPSTSAVTDTFWQWEAIPCVLSQTPL